MIVSTKYFKSFSQYSLFLRVTKIPQAEQETNYTNFLSQFRSSTFKGAYLSALDDFLTLNQNHEYDFTFKVCNERIVGAPVVMYFRKNYFLVPAINKIIGRLISGGLITFYHQNHLKRNVKIEKDATGNQKALELSHMFGCFQILGCGCCIGLICFLAEFLTFAMKTFLMKNSVSKV